MRIRPWAAAAALFATITIVPVIHSQATQANPATPEDEIRAFSKEWADAEVARDRKTLERILDDGFVATFSSGKTLEKAAFIQLIATIMMPPFNIVHDVIHVNGDTAIVVDRFGANLDTKCTWVAVKRNGEWRAIAEQMTRVPPTAPVASPPPAPK
jgi:ketosteroid isomerase-like protein